MIEKWVISFISAFVMLSSISQNVFAASLPQKVNKVASHSSFAMLPAIWWFLIVYVER